MANTSARLYIRSPAGYSAPPKELADLLTGHSYQKLQDTSTNIAQKAHVLMVGD